MLILLAMCSLMVRPQSIVAVEPPIPPKPLTTTEHIQKVFGDKAPLMTAIFKAESSLNTKNVNWNCHYYKIVINQKTGKEENKRYSTSCKTKAERVNAWSVDCGIAQINHRGKVCPEHLFKIENNLAIAKQKLDTQGLKAWSVYTNGTYKRFL